MWTCAGEMNGSRVWHRGSFSWNVNEGARNGSHGTTAARHWRAGGSHWIRQDDRGCEDHCSTQGRHARPGAFASLWSNGLRACEASSICRRIASARLAEAGVRPTGVIDIAMIQSLARGGVVDDLVAEFGQLI